MLNDGTQTQKQTHVRTAVHTRHNRVCKVTCWHICKSYDVPVPENLWEHEPKVITENMEVPTAHLRSNDPIEREHRKQSILNRYHTSVQKKEKKALLIEVLVPVIWTKRCRNQENDQTPRPQE